MTTDSLLAHVQEWAGEGWTVIAGQSMNVLKVERFKSAADVAHRFFELMDAEIPTVMVYRTSAARETRLVASVPNVKFQDD